MKPRRVASIPEALAARSRDYQRQLLAESYAELASECADLLPRAADPDPPAPRLTRCLGALEVVAGRPAPEGTLSGWDVYRIARARSTL